MLTSLSVDTITAAGAIIAAGYSTTGTANFRSTNTDILYVSTMMLSAGAISVGTLSGKAHGDGFSQEV